MQKSILLSLLLAVSLVAHSMDATRYDKIYDHFKSFSLQALIEKGDHYYQTASLDSALVCFSIVSGSYLPEQTDADKKLCAHAYNRCGTIYLQYASYAKSLNMLLKGLEICEESNYHSYTPRIYNNIANIYYVFHDYKTAENYCEKAYELGIKYNNKEIQEIVLNNLVGINCYRKDYEKAQHHLALLNNLNPGNKSTSNYYLSISNGAIDLKQKKNESALKWFKNSLQYADSCYNPYRLKYVSYSNISKTFSYLNQKDSAIFYLKKGEAIALRNQYTDLISECYGDFFDIYNLSGEEQMSLVYKRKFLNLTDSIFNVQEFGRIKDMQFLYEMDKIDKQIYRLTDAQLLKDNQIKFQQQILYTVCGAFLIIAVLLVIMYFQNKKLREANIELFNKNLEIMASEEKQKKARKQSVEEMQANVQRPKLKISISQEESPKEEPEITAETDDAQDSKVKYHRSVINEEEKKRLRESIQDIMDNTQEYCSVNFNLEKMAALVNSKSKYVSQVINESYGKNFNVFINEYRIKEARRRLSDLESYGNFTIASIATSVGFRSNANFNLIFKKVTGMTPTMYQEMAHKHQEKMPA